MADVTIRMRPNGPRVIEGPFKLVDSRGAEFEIHRAAQQAHFAYWIFASTARRRMPLLR